MEDEQIKKKRGRKKKVEEPVNNITAIIEDEDINEIVGQTCLEPLVNTTTTLKKRGRKPKGGKLITKQIEKTNLLPEVTNIILHLKCSLTDLDKVSKFVTDPHIYNPIIPPSIMSYNLDEKTEFTPYDMIPTTEEPVSKYAYNGDCVNCCKCGLKQSHKNETSDDTNDTSDDTNDTSDDKSLDIKDINAKLKRLKLDLYRSSNIDKKSACFWCTYDFDNPPCYIPNCELDGQLVGYGSFCRPECAVAYLMKENLDDSTKFERYQLLNQVYGKVYDYKNNIKPAPNPYFLLEKFYGNLTIQEYRKLMKTKHMLLVVEKPMTRILPELHEDSEDFVMNIFGGKQLQTNNTGVYKVKRQSEKTKGPSKKTIMKENFGF
jgi:hypothetical protein